MGKAFRDGRDYFPSETLAFWAPVEPATSITETHYFPALTGNRSGKYFLGCTPRNSTGAVTPPAWMQWRSYENDCPGFWFWESGSETLPLRLVPSKSLFFTSLLNILPVLFRTGPNWMAVVPGLEQSCKREQRQPEAYWDRDSILNFPRNLCPEFLKLYFRANSAHQALHQATPSSILPACMHAK